MQPTLIHPTRLRVSGWETLDALLTLAPEKLVYISCDPATLARDIAFLTEHSFTLQSVTPVDLFPRTTHVESVALLTRK